MAWNFAAVIQQIAASELGQRTALIHADRHFSFQQLQQRCSALADFFVAQELARGAHVGHLMRNSNAYIETFLGCGLAGTSHVNLNFRYQARELLALCDSLDIEVLVYDREFAAQAALIQRELPAVSVFVEVGPDPHCHNTFAHCHETLVSAAPAGHRHSPAGDDLLLIATGGTTGLPKGVQWRHEDLWHSLNISTQYDLAVLALQEAPQSVNEHVDNLIRARQQLRDMAGVDQQSRFMPLSPLMHGAGLMATLIVLSQAGCVITVPGQRLDADQVLDTLVEQKVGRLALVGDAFARPLLQALERRADEQLFAGLDIILSTGASLSEDCKRGFLHHKADLFVIDTLGSSEAAGFAVSSPRPGCFVAGPDTRVFDDAGKAVEPGSDTIGIVARGGHIPIGYYNEPERSAQTFVSIDGKRYTLTGDRARVLSDGLIELLGRDSTCINSGGEKVYTVEVERVLMEQEDITDALVIGLPHARFGSMVVAVIEHHRPDAFDEQGIRQSISRQLADYKVPKHIFVIDDLGRAANGKPDYPATLAYAQQQYARLDSNSA